MKEPVIGIALGGGGALGMAHIGVLKALEENNIKPHIIAGTSIGAIVGGVYSTGMDIAGMEKRALKIKTANLFDVNLNPSGVLSGKATERVLRRILGTDPLIEQLPIKFSCVAVDVNKGEEYIFSKGSLIHAIRASMSVPGIFVPYKYEDKMLVDGGVLNNVPANIVKQMGADVVIAVNLVADFEPYTKAKTLIHSVAFSFFIMQKELTKYQLKKYDVLLTPPLKDYRQYIFSEKTNEEIIKIGYDETIKHIRQIKNKIEKAKKA